MSYTNDLAGLQNQLPFSIEFSEDPKLLRYDLTDAYQGIASAVNNKTGGLFVPQEKINSEQYYDPNNPQRFLSVYRMVVDFGALPNSTTKSVAHNIQDWNSSFRLTSAYGASTDTSNLQALPIPNNGIELKINSTYVTITTTSNLSSYTETNIVVEYTKG